MQKLQISISCIITGLILSVKNLRDSFLQKKHSSKTYMHLTLEEKPYMYYLLVNIKKFSLITSTGIIGK